MTYLTINNKILPAKKAKISADDRGFLFGDALFETCLIFDGVIYNWPAHLNRLQKGLMAIKIDFDLSNLKKSAQQLIKKNKIKKGYLRIAISRGVGNIGYLPKNTRPTLVIKTVKSTAKAKKPVKLWVSDIQKPSLKSLPVNYKLANSLNSILAKMQAVENDYFDSLLLNSNQEICETSSANIFWVKDDILYTPDLNCGCLAGTIREKIIALSPIKIKQVKAGLESLLTADEAFICNVSLLILAIDEIENKQFKQQKYSKIINKLLQLDIKNYAKNHQS